MRLIWWLPASKGYLDVEFSFDVSEDSEGRYICEDGTIFKVEDIEADGILLPNRLRIIKIGEGFKRELEWILIQRGWKKEEIEEFFDEISNWCWSTWYIE